MGQHNPSQARGVLICANPFSGAGPNRRYVDGLVDALRNRGLEPKLVWDLNERRALLADSGLAEHYRCVVAAGGDGSIHAVVNELGAAGRLDNAGDQPRAAFATLPMGNENLFAAHFGFTRDVGRLASAIEAGQTKRIDLGRVTPGTRGGQNSLFTLMASIGFDADVVHRMDRWRVSVAGLRRVRRSSYVPRVLSSLCRYAYPVLSIQADEQTLSGAHLFVFNLPHYGGGLRIAPMGCRADDGLLDWVLFEKPGRWPLLGAAGAVLRGKHLGSQGVRHGRSARLRVDVTAAGLADAGSTPTAPLQVDGDPAGMTPVDIEVDRRRGLELLIT
jgi:diacylglycerol kinase family enzyme